MTNLSGQRKYLLRSWHVCKDLKKVREWIQSVLCGFCICRVNQPRTKNIWEKQFQKVPKIKTWICCVPGLPSLVAQMVKNVGWQCRRPGFSPWVGKIPWRRKWQPTPVLLPGESHGQRSLVGTVQGVAESQTGLSEWYGWNKMGHGCWEATDGS